MPMQRRFRTHRILNHIPSLERNVRLVYSHPCKNRKDGHPWSGMSRGDQDQRLGHPPVGTAAYTISTRAATPTFSPAGGTYTSAQTVTISDTTTGATIYYTTNGTTPTTSSTRYTVPISVSATETIKAIAVAAGFSQSRVGSAAYTIP
jgi:hypothetical protein